MTITIERIRCKISAKTNKKRNEMLNAIKSNVKYAWMRLIKVNALAMVVLTMYGVTSNNQKIRASRMKPNYRTMICERVKRGNKERSVSTADTERARQTTTAKRSPVRCVKPLYAKPWFVVVVVVVVMQIYLPNAIDTYNDFKLCKPKNILLWISAILFSDKSKSCIFDAPSNAFCSMPVIWLRRKSSFTKFGRRPNNPSDLMRPSSLSFSNL